MTFEEFIFEWRTREQNIEVNTSGSTGVPKKIMLSKKFMIESAKRTNEFFNITKDCRFHSCVAADFIGGKMMAVRAEISGAGFTWETPSNYPLAFMQEKNLSDKDMIHLLAVVPSQMIYILENSSFWPHLRNIIVGGSAIHPELRKKIEKSGLNAFETYGMTETASHIALRKISYCQTPFKTLKGITVEYNPQGCLVINFDSGQQIVTNDLAEIISSKEFLIKGRSDNVIITGGRKVHPEEVEEKIAKFLTSPFLISGLQDEKWGEKVVLYIEDDKEESDPQKEKREKKLWEFMKMELTKWEQPKEIIYIKKLPRASGGKLKRKFKN